MEARFEFVLHERVFAVCESFFVAPFRVEAYEVACYVFDACLGAFFQPFPLSCAEIAEAWRFSVVLRFVFRYFVERVYRYVYGVSALILQFYHLLIRVAVRHTHKSTEFSHAVVNVYDIVSDFELHDVFERERHFPASYFV